jgi:hypothetical protein
LLGCSGTGSSANSAQNEAARLDRGSLVALYVGVAVHLLGHVAFRRRNIGTWNPHRSLAAVVLVVLLPLAWQLPALAALALVAGVLVGLVGYEAVRLRVDRDRLRHHNA